MQAQANVVLLKSTSQKWLSGVRGGGQSLEYNFQVLVSMNASVRFDSIWLPRGKFPAKVVKQHRLVSQAVLQPNDTATLVISEFTPPVGHLADTAMTLSPIVPPIDFAGAALIRYYVGKEKKYLVCKAIDRLPDIHGQ